MSTSTEIRTQVAAKIAADFVVQSYRHDDQCNLEKMCGDFIATLDMVANALTVKNAEELAKENFPGSAAVQDTVTTQAQPSNVVQFPAQQAQSAAGPSPIPGAADGDPWTADLWREYFNNPGNFYDNSKDKRSEFAPDFAHKTKLDQKGKYKAGLYLPKNDKYKKNPSWVEKALAGERF